jgi:hypothetical protein
MRRSITKLRRGGDDVAKICWIDSYVLVMRLHGVRIQILRYQSSYHGLLPANFSQRCSSLENLKSSSHILSLSRKFSNTHTLPQHMLLPNTTANTNPASVRVTIEQFKKQEKSTLNQWSFPEVFKYRSCVLLPISSTARNQPFFTNISPLASPAPKKN